MKWALVYNLIRWSQWSFLIYPSWSQLLSPFRFRYLGDEHDLQRLVELIRRKFTPVIMANRQIMERIWIHLKNFNAEIDRSLNNNSRIPLKVACVNTNRTLCDLAFKQIDLFQEQEQEERQERQAGTTGAGSSCASLAQMKIQLQGRTQIYQLT